LGQLTPDAARRICVILAGRATPMREAELQKQSAALCARLPLQFISHCAYVPHADVGAYFQLADVILTPYPQHNGMSGILLLAAAYQKPALSSAYGLMGEMTRRHKLGLAVDVSKHAQLADALTRFLSGDTICFCDLQQMQDFTARHDPDQFAAEVFQSLE
jgi:glycosyltransferase involved in cell wall biosynthesis